MINHNYVTIHTPFGYKWDSHYVELINKKDITGDKVLLNPNGTRRSIVLVDDEPDLIQLFSGVLKSAGFDVISFDNPLSAVDYMQEHHSEICLLVTDWRMPEMNGLELTKKVTEIDHEIKAMLMSAYDLEKDQLKEINNNDYLRKPIENNKLIDAVKKEVYGTITV